MINFSYRKLIHSGFSRRGFTLIEVLISLALLTVVLGALYSSFFSVQRAVERFDDVSLKYHDARTALDIMRREIEGSLLIMPRDPEKEETGTSFVITDRDIFGKITSSLDLTAFSFRSGGTIHISYYVEESEGKLNLLKTETPPVIDAKEYSIEIIEGIESFTVETLFLNEWVKTWDTAETDKLPDIVRVTIAFDDNGKIVELTEYAKPRTGRRL